ncbi:MAG: hypothetical protein P4L84_18340 [Isosphaeraceae bacterium]|nr:hypothetical protein [Isosphaeraceae bacterium]
MSVLLRGSIRRKLGVRRRGITPSVREICLLGAAGSKWAPGDRVSRSGRTYRVEATQQPLAGEAGALGYMHLSSLAEG